MPVVSGAPVRPSDLTGDFSVDDLTVAGTVSGAGFEWTTWTPTLTNLAAGSTAVVARYRRVGDLIDWYFRWVFSSGASVGNDPSFTLPAAPAGHYPTGGEAFFPCTVRLGDTMTTYRPGDLTLTSGSTVRLVSWNATPTIAQITSAAPWTWTTGDFITAWGTYEPA